MVQQVKGSTLDQSAWTAYAPTYSSDIGNAAATFSGGGVVTSTLASYYASGKKISLAFNFSALTIGVTPAYIKVSAPTGVLPKVSTSYTPCVIQIAGVWETGMMRGDSSGFLYFYRANQALFPANTTLLCAVETNLEIA
jgi:hypothetical protein